MRNAMNCKSKISRPLQLSLLWLFGLLSLSLIGVALAWDFLNMTS